MNALDQSRYVDCHLRALAGLLLMVAGATMAHGDTVYKCRDAHGLIAYQDHACADPARQTLIAIVPGPIVDTAPVVAPRASTARGAQRNAVRTSSGRASAHAKELISYECRAADGEVFYRHSGCPKTMAVAPASGRGSSGRKAAARGAAARSTSVSAQPVPRKEVCKRMASAGSIGRAGRGHDDAVSTYDRNAGRDPCRNS